jgi:hypothetical protein
MADAHDHDHEPFGRPQVSDGDTVWSHRVITCARYLCKAELSPRFSDIRIRQGEQGTLNFLREHPQIEFPLANPAESYA